MKRQLKHDIQSFRNFEIACTQVLKSHDFKTVNYKTIYNSNQQTSHREARLA